MTDPVADRSPQRGAEASGDPPRTGDEAIDEALLKLADLSEVIAPGAA